MSTLAMFAYSGFGLNEYILNKQACPDNAIPEEITSFALAHHPAFSLECSNYYHQEDFIKAEVQGMKPALQEDHENLIFRCGECTLWQGLQCLIP